MRYSYLVGLCLSTCLTSPAAAENWYQVATTDNSIDYADADTIRAFGDTMSVDVLRGFAGDGTSSGYAKVALDIACASNQVRMTNAVRYDSQRQYLSTDNTVSEWQTITDNSVAQQVRRFTCDGALRETHVSNPFDDADDYWYYYGF